MRPHGLQTIAAACLQIGIFLAATTLAANAQTWHWTYVTRTPNSPLLTAQSLVAISGNHVQMSYTVPLQNRQIVIESCRADLHDISEATTIRTSGTAYLLVRFKPAHSAACASGVRPAVALPTDDEQFIGRVAAAINRTCCAAVAALTPPAAPTPKAAPAAKPTPAPVATAADSPAASPAAAPSTAASPSPTPKPSRAAVRDWVENDGLFWFVRLRNVGTVPIVSTGDVFDCRNVDIGCGAFTRVTIDPGATVTLATIASTNRGAVPAFDYRYTAGEGADAVSGSGSSARGAPHVVRMSDQELRAAQATALSQLAAAHPAAAAPLQPARLIKRGSSRLAIGQTGIAVVRLMISADGTPQEATIVSVSNKQLTAAAIETAVSSTYAPAVQSGRTVAAKYVATFSFDGQDPALSAVPVWKRSPAPEPPTPAAQLSTGVPAAPSAAAAAASSAAPEAGASPAAGVKSSPPTPPAPNVPAAAPASTATPASTTSVPADATSAPH